MSLSLSFLTRSDLNTWMLIIVFPVSFLVAKREKKRGYREEVSQSGEKSDGLVVDSENTPR